MSKYQTVQITCPECETVFDVKKWDSVNVQINPEEKERMLSGDFFNHQCPECATISCILFTCLYHDMSSQLMVYLIPLEPGKDPSEALGMIENVSQLLDDPSADLLFFKDGYKHRVVFHREDLMEKIKINDEGLDDRVIEVLKLIMLHQLGEDVAPAKIEYFLFDTITGKREFTIFLDSGDIGQVDFPQDAYDKIETSFAQAIEAGTPKGFQFVDRKWAFEEVFQKVDSAD